MRAKGALQLRDFSSLGAKAPRLLRALRWG
jgi:hypothetical protein